MKGSSNWTINGCSHRLNPDTKVYQLKDFMRYSDLEAMVIK